MKIIVRNIFLGFALAATSIAYAAVPVLTVTVADSGGKAAYKGSTNAKGTFATGVLKPGGYVVQFNSPNAPKGNYALVVSAGKKKVTANAVAAEKLAKGGVAMRIEVGAGLNITGQVASSNQNSAPIGANGKPMVWIPPMLGSNMQGHWAEADSAEAVTSKNRSQMSKSRVEAGQISQ